MKNRLRNESGFALLLTIFILTLATVIVFNFGERVRYEQRSTRGFTESIQAEFILKSGLNFALLLLEIPTDVGSQETWLGEPWSTVPTFELPIIPIPGFIGDVRIQITDDHGKIDLNSVVGQGFIPNQQDPTQITTNPVELFWMNTLNDLFSSLGFQAAQFDDTEFVTFGNILYDSADQVAILHDWIDRDNVSYRSGEFTGQGRESEASMRAYFYNRPLKSLHEALLVPGMTKDRLNLISPFVTVSAHSQVSQQVNINTAPYPVLLAMGLPESEVSRLVEIRQATPITREDLNTLTATYDGLRNYLKVDSSEFSIYIQVVMPSVTKWLYAKVAASGQGQNKRARVLNYQIF